MVEVPLSVADGAVQVNVCAAPAPASGGVVLLLISCVAVEVQPFVLSVTVSVYVPAAVTAGFVVVALKPPGPLQL